MSTTRLSYTSFTPQPPSLSINAIPSQAAANQIEAAIRALDGKRLEMGQVRVNHTENRPPIGKMVAADKTAGRQRQVP